MKKTMLALSLVLLSSSAFADQTWTVTSTGTNNSPISTDALAAQVKTGIANYKKLNKEVGELQNWTCTVIKASAAGPGQTYVDNCVANLDLPADWDYYGSFRLNLGFDRFNQSTITSLNYQWVNQ